jgi:chloramphenicol 3-O phosphotransferase
MYEGTIVILNGASSAGKSSLAKSLQSVMLEPFLHLSIDHEAFLFPNHCYDMQQLSDEELTRFWSAFIHSVALYAKFGNRIIFDTVSDSDWVVDECCKAFKACNVYFIGIHCSLEVLRRREIERGDREIGQAERQLLTVHRYGTYDFTVDTTELTSEQCAIQIKAFMEGNPAPLEFKNLCLTRALVQLIVNTP